MDDIRDHAKTERIASYGHLFLVGGVLFALWLTQVCRLRWMAAHPGENPHRIGTIPFCSLGIAWEWFAVGLVWLGIRKFGVSIRQLVGGEWYSAREFFRDAASGLAVWFTWTAYAGVVAHFVGGQRELPRYIVDVMPRTPLELGAWLVLSVSAGFSEEFVFRGYLLRQFTALTSSFNEANLCQAIIFGMMHVYQGFTQAALIASLGYVLGLLANRRNSLRPGILLHIWMDALASVIMFLLR